MLSSTIAGRELVYQVSLQILEQIAPEEVEIFPELAEEFYTNPELPELSGNSTDDELAFGLDGSLIPVSHAIISAVIYVLNYLVTDVLKEAKGEISEALKTKIKALFENEKLDGKPKKGKITPILTKEELELVKKMARKQARIFGLGEADARKLADALVGSLATI
jgi:hypothetical protein